MSRGHRAIQKLRRDMAQEVSERLNQMSPPEREQKVRELEQAGLIQRREPLNSGAGGRARPMISKRGEQSGRLKAP